jgi:hypothetical protein
LTNSPIYIDLDAALDVRRLPSEQELIQQSAYARFRQLLTERLESLSKSGNQHGPIDDDGTALFIDRRQNAIAIHGSRGTGKTTFVRNAFALIKDDKPLGDRIATLGVVDPTLIENKENVFVIVVNKIRDAVDLSHENTVGRKKAEEYERWRQGLRELAGGLMLLDGIGADKPLAEGWDDKQYILQRGLDKVGDAAGLEVKFHTFIERSLDFLNKQCFLLAFDDVDTSFSRGWPVLEVVRRYLTSPHWVSVICGDLDLFAILVRGQQWANFEEKSLKHDDPNISSFRSMVDHLQGQYLLKVLRPNYRIALQPVAALADRIRVRWEQRNTDAGNGDLPLAGFVDTLVQERLKFRGRWEHRLIAELLLRQPIRTVLQVLALGRPSGAATDDVQIPERFARELASVFTDALLRYNLSPDELYEAGSTRLLPRLAQFLTDNRRWLVAHSLFPDHQDDNFNLAILGLGAWIRQEFERLPHLAFEYFIRICLSQQVLSTRPQGLGGVYQPEGPVNDGVSADAHANFANFAELGRLSVTTGVAGRIIAAIAADAIPTNARPRFGIIPLYKRDAVRYRDLVRRLYGFTPASAADDMPTSVASPIQPFHAQIVATYGTPTVYTGTWFNTIDSLTERLDVTSSVLASLPVSRVLRGTSERSAFFSVYRLVAVLGRLVELATSHAPVTTADIADVLRSESIMPAFDVPPWTTWLTPNPPEEVDSEAPPDSAQGPDTLAQSSVVQHLLSWVQRMPRPKPPPPYVLARAWQRFHQTLTSIDEEIPSHQWFLGHLFHRHIIAFLNSCLVEETLHWQTIDIMTRNPVSDNQIFLRNLRLAATATHPFFDFVWASPLWGAFLEPGDTDLFASYRQAVAVTDAPAAVTDAPVAVTDAAVAVTGAPAPVADAPVAVTDSLNWTATYTTSAQPPRTPPQFYNLYPVLNSVGVIGVNARQVGMPPTTSGSGPSPSRSRPGAKRAAR